jgi:hypothetical protein
VFFYFDTRDQDKVQYHSFVCSLLCQLAEKATEKENGYALKELQELYVKSDKGKYLVAENIGITLKNLLMKMDTVYMVIDAMDECEEQAKVFALIDMLLGDLNNCYVLLSSRPHVNEIFISMREGLRVIALNSKGSGMELDIERYVDSRLEKRLGLTAALKAEIKDVLVNNADGQ